MKKTYYKSLILIARKSQKVEHNYSETNSRCEQAESFLPNRADAAIREKFFSFFGVPYRVLRDIADLRDGASHDRFCRKKTRSIFQSMISLAYNDSITRVPSMPLKPSVANTVLFFISEVWERSLSEKIYFDVPELSFMINRNALIT